MSNSRIIAPRRDTSANWAAADPVLAKSEIAFDSNINEYKVGDGLKKWSELDFVIPLNSSYTVLTVPAAANYTGAWIFVSNETGGPVMAFSDGTDWRRCTDRIIIS